MPGGQLDTMSEAQFYCFSPGGACSGKDSVSVAGVAPLSPDATQSPAHSLVPFTVPTSLQPIGSFGFTRTSGLLPTFGSLSLARAFAEKQIATRMTLRCGDRPFRQMRIERARGDIWRFDQFRSRKFLGLSLVRKRFGRCVYRKLKLRRR